MNDHKIRRLNLDCEWLSTQSKYIHELPPFLPRLFFVIGVLLTQSRGGKVEEKKQVHLLKAITKL